ncbi:hypothetical protein [Streptomyces sp. enrichment culture]|uniref:hypothetical protein n=1 Tax=Streptomyces sp. enrichment culture TaxID=1795815 RepID=UPI003F56B9C9
MADSPDTPFAPYDEQLRAITDLPERWKAYVDRAKHLERELESFRKRQRQEIATGLKAQGKTWKEVGEIMGGVTYQRAHQFGRGE